MKTKQKAETKTTEGQPTGSGLGIYIATKFPQVILTPAKVW